MKGKRERDNTQEHTRKSTRPCVISHEEKEGHTHHIQTYTRPLYIYRRRRSRRELRGYSQWHHREKAPCFPERKEKNLILP